MLRNYTSRVGLTALIALGSIGSLLASDAPEVSEDGLKLIENSRRSSLYADPQADWSQYSEIRLLEATVAFRKNWQRDQNRSDPFKVKASDMERIKSDLAQLFNEVLTEELTANGDYVMVEESGDSVLTIKPSIVDLDVTAPDTMRAGTSRQFTESSGEMTLKLEIMDSVTGDLLAKSSDRLEDPRRGYMQWTTGVTNRAEARRLMQQWAKNLHERLDKVREGTPDQASE